MDLFDSLHLHLFDGQHMDVLGRGYAPSYDDCWSELRCYCCNNIQCGVGLNENFKIGWIVSNYYVKSS